MATKAVYADQAGNAPRAISGAGDLLQFAELETAAFCAEWDDLARDSAEPNVFYERWYLLPSLRYFGKDTQMFAPRVNGQLIGLMPFSHQGQYGRWPVPNVQNWLHPNLFLGTPLVRSGHERIFWQLLLAQFDAQPGKAMFLHINGMTSDGALAAALADICGDGRRFAEVDHSDRAFLQSPMNAAEYYAANMRGKKRKELRRQKNRLEDEGELAVMRSDGSVGLSDWVNEFLALEQAGWKGREGSALSCNADTQRMFADTLSGAAAQGKLQLLDLRIDGRPLAMLVNFISAPGCFSFKTAFDESFSRYSPGVLLQIENLALLENPDVEWCDSCAAEGHPMIDSIWSDRRRIGRFSIAIGGAARRIAFGQYLNIELARARKREAVVKQGEAV